MIQLLIFPLMVVLAGSGSATQTDDLEISHRARSMQPGEVILLNVAGPPGLKHVEAHAFGKRFLLEGVGDGRWQGLVGIDLNTEPGPYSIRVAADSGGSSVAVEHRVEIEPREFPTRRLNVDPKFVTPPPEVGERIARESRRLGAVLSSLGAERLWSGTWTRPVPGEATSSFGKRSIFNGKPRSPHTGTDFRAAAGTPVLAPAAGRITLADDLYYSGQTVVIDHGHGLVSLMAHLSRIDVREGAAVAAGDRLGLVGATGRVTGPHLHWAMRLAGARVDPLSLMEVAE